MIYLLTFLRILFNFLYFGSSVLTRVSSTYGDRVKWTTMDATLKPLLVHWCFAGQRVLAAIAIRLALAETLRLHWNTGLVIYLVNSFELGNIV